MKKYSLYLLLFVVVLFTACKGKKKKEQQSYSDKMAQVINQAPNGYINSTDLIQIGFTKDMISSNGINTALKEKLFTFKPALDGETYWKDKNTLVFKPSKELPFHETYSGKLNLTPFKTLVVGT